MIERLSKIQRFWILKFISLQVTNLSTFYLICWLLSQYIVLFDFNVDLYLYIDFFY
jgi:hypothetical protein